LRELTPEDLQWLEQWHWERRGGRPANEDRNRELLKAPANGLELRAFICRLLKRELGRVPEMKEICSLQRQIYRLRAKRDEREAPRVATKPIF
jgi:hypothetical protein